MARAFAVALFFGSGAVTPMAQQAGMVTPEESPGLVLHHCTKQNGCQAEQASMVMDANWRWVHNVDGYKNCFDQKGWSPEFCPDIETCKKKCAIEGITADSYSKTYGVEKESDGVTLKFISQKGNVGSRLYVTDSEDTYKSFMLLNREFTIDVDVSTLDCGLNGAAYFIEMDRFGGKGKNGNEAGAKFGAGYCDAQCPNEKWNFDSTQGICCVEMDIWEANNKAAAYTPHPCSTEGPTHCEGLDCGYGENGERWKGLCDKDGCDMNAYRMGAENFYGPGSNYKLDSTKPMTVVTQFLTNDGTDDGHLVEIRRLYIQDGKLIEHAESAISNVTGNSITDEFCNAQKTVFKDFDHHQAKGGLKSMGEALKRGMVLSLSVWDDFSTQMRWLDSTFPPHEPADKLGVARGPCDGTTSHPDHVRKVHRDAFVKYTNIKYGEIGSTYTVPDRRLEAIHV